MTTPALRVNGLQIVTKSTPPDPHGFGPFTGIQIQKQSEPPPHYGGGVLWSDGDALHWTTVAGRDVVLPRVTGSQLLAIDDLDHALSTQAEGQVVAGVVGAASVLFVLLFMRLGAWLARKVATAAWVARQSNKPKTPYR